MKNISFDNKMDLEVEITEVGEIEAVINEPVIIESIIIPDLIEDQPDLIEDLSENDFHDGLTEWDLVPDLYDSVDLDDDEISLVEANDLDNCSEDLYEDLYDDQNEDDLNQHPSNELVNTKMVEEIIGAYYTIIHFKYGGKISLPFVSRNFGRYRVSISYINRRNAIFLRPRIKMGTEMIEPIHSCIQEIKDFLIVSHDFQVNFIGRGKFKMEIPSMFDLLRDYPFVDDFFTLKRSTIGLYFHPRDLDGYPQCRFIQEIPSRFEIEIRLYAMI
jgi:hypothetical protein